MVCIQSTKWYLPTPTYMHTRKHAWLLPLVFPLTCTNYKSIFIFHPEYTSLKYLTVLASTLTRFNIIYYLMSTTLPIASLQYFWEGWSWCLIVTFQINAPVWLPGPCGGVLELILVLSGRDTEQNSYSICPTDHNHPHWYPQELWVHLANLMVLLSCLNQDIGSTQQ